MKSYQYNFRNEKFLFENIFNQKVHSLGYNPQSSMGLCLVVLVHCRRRRQGSCYHVKLNIVKYRCLGSPIECWKNTQTDDSLSIIDRLYYPVMSWFLKFLLMRSQSSIWLLFCSAHLSPFPLLRKEAAVSLPTGTSYHPPS